MSKLHDQAILAGINDNSFEMAYNNAAKAREAEKQRKLEELLRAQDGQRKQDSLARNEAAARADAQRRGLKDGEYSMTVNESGWAVNPENPHNGLMSLLNLRERQDARDDRDLTRLGDRIAKENLPQGMAGMANLEKGTASVDAKGKPVGGLLTNPEYQVKSAGPVANFLPQPIKNIGERMGLMPKGAGEEAALIQRLMNVDIRNLSGTAVTGYEQGRQNVEKGMAGGGDPNLIKVGIKQMQDALEESARNVEASTRPEVAAKYRQQGGAFRLDEFLGGGQAPTQQPKKEYSPSRNQTRITHPDGRVEILDGKH